MADDIEQVLPALRRFVIDSPELQARLFDIVDTESFIAAVQQLVSSSGRELQDEALRQALRAGYKAWIDRRLP